MPKQSGTDKLPLSFDSLENYLFLACLTTFRNNHCAITKTVQSGLKSRSKLAVGCNLKAPSVFGFVLETLTKKLHDLELSKPEIDQAVKNALERFGDLPGVQEALVTLEKLVTDSVLSTDKSPDKEEFVIKIDEQVLEQRIYLWVEKEYARLDERELSSNDRRVRRMDSLSRLLALDPALSVCTAVSIDTSAKPPRLVIAANVKKDGLQDDVIAALAKKIEIIKASIDKLASTKRFTVSELLKHTDELTASLKTVSSSEIPEDVRKQAALKCLHAICFDQNTFTEKELDAFLNDAPYVILLPKTGKNGLQIHEHKMTADGSIKHEFDVATSSTVVDVSKVHAEQILVHYLVNILKNQPSGLLGISKLCCKTCFDFLKNYPEYEKRGTHKQDYDGVISLEQLATGDKDTIGTEEAKKEEEKDSSPKYRRRSITCPWTSPGDTPLRDLPATGSEQREESKIECSPQRTPQKLLETPPRKTNTDATAPSHFSPLKLFYNRTESNAPSSPPDQEYKGHQTPPIRTFGIFPGLSKYNNPRGTNSAGQSHKP